MALPKGLPQVSDINTIGEILDNGFQAFVDEKSNILTASSSMPAGQLGGSGVFRSSVVGRAPITDISQDLKASMGIERIPVQSIYQLQDEFGPNGEPVWAALNDDKGLIRFVGSWANFNSTTNGLYVSGQTANDYVEVTFYGTGISWITLANTISSTVVVYSVDGQADSADVAVTQAGVLLGRNYSANVIVPLASNLALGIHTVILKITTVGNFLNVHGFEILNESSSVIVNPGTSYSQGKKLTLTSQQTPAYASGFTNVSGTAGTRGGRVLVYLASDGTVKKDVQYVDTAAAYLTSASHANEEVVRRYNFAEFSSGRSDDFNNNNVWNNVISAAFTLDDGTTTLVGAGVNAATNLFSSGRSAITVYSSQNPGFLTITFVGTGLDISISGDGNASRQFDAVVIDGVTVGSIPSAIYSQRILKICSGLPYGTHTVKFNHQSLAATSMAIHDFIVYGPKKPSLPSGAVELADYNVMADFVANSTAGVDYISTGTLRKANIREMTYVGSGWSTGAVLLNVPTGFGMATGVAGDYVEYTFFGTGFEIRVPADNARSTANTLTLNGLSLSNTYPGSSGISCRVYGLGQSYGGQVGSFLLSSAVNNQYDLLESTVTAGNGLTGGLSMSGFPLGVYKIRFTAGAGGGNIWHTIDIITPIHSAKSSLYADLQNTLPVGSCAISDNRKTSAIKESLSSQKAWAQAFGITGGPTTNITTGFIPCPDMSITLKTSGNPVEVFYSVQTSFNTNQNRGTYAVFIDGAIAAKQKSFGSGASYESLVSDSFIVPLSAGVHKIDLYWVCSDVGTMTAVGTNRNIKAREL